MPFAHPTRAEVSLDAITRNVDLLKGLAGDAAIMAVVKADAYGHGARRIGRHLEKLGIGSFAVATVQEATALRDAGIEGRILVFAPPVASDVPAFIEYDLDLSLTSLDGLTLIREKRFAGRVHLKIDTGMRRVGVRPEQIAEVMDQSGDVDIHAFWTHLATADEESSTFVKEQVDRFNAAIAPYRDAVEYTHVANSGALLNHRQVLDVGKRAMVRPGITIYGLSPSPDVDQAARAGFEPAMRVVSRVSHVQTVSVGESVSYSRRWTAARSTRVVTVQAGYADGIPRALTNKGHVGIGEALNPIVGTVCMDAFMADVGESTRAAIGDDAIVFGRGGPSCFDVARAAGTITYEITCRVSPRVARVYTEETGRSKSNGGSRL